MQCSINGGHVYDAISSIAPTVAISTALGFAAIRTLCRYILYTTEPVFGVLNELNGWLHGLIYVGEQVGLDKFDTEVGFLLATAGAQMAA